MKPATVLICLIVKKVRVRNPEILDTVTKDLVPPLIQTPENKEDQCENIGFSNQAVLAVVLLVIILMTFSRMDTSQPIKFKKSEQDLSEVLRVFVPQALDTSRDKTMKNSLDDGDLVRSGSFKFKKGILVKKKGKRSTLKSPVKKVSPPKRAFSSVDLSKSPSPIEEGNISVVYKLLDKDGSPTAVFKPYESTDTANPLNKENIFPGKDGSDQLLSPKAHCVNEVLAYKFDQSLPEAIRAGVPETRSVNLPTSLFGNESQEGSVKGSMQKFVVGGESSEDYGPSLFSVDDVHKIGILDLLILNCDRHSGNLLFNPSTKKLSPIDHALSFPSIDLFGESRELEAGLSRDSFDEMLTLKNVNFDWLMFPQAKQPFSGEVVESVANIDFAALEQEIVESELNSQQKLAFFAAFTLLQTSVVKYGKTLREIGEIVQRTGDRKSPSVLESLVSEVVSKLDLKKLELGNEEELTLFKEGFQSSVENYLKL